MNRVSYVDGFARKALGDVPVLVGYRLAELSREAAGAGVPTPSLTFQPATRELISLWIDGLNGRELLQRYMKGNSSFAAVPKTFWSSLLSPLVHLHRSKLKRADLQPFDSYRRIRPRLQNKNMCAAAIGISREWRLYRTLRNIGSSLIPVHDIESWVPVHGDFHVGQVIFDTDNHTPMLLDLDDLAIGVPESDIGNCIAHLVTAFGDVTNRITEKFNDLTHLLLECYFESTSRQLAPELVNFYGAAALLRRVLKLSERHRDESLVYVLSAAETLAASCHGDLVR